MASSPAESNIKLISVVLDVSKLVKSPFSIAINLANQDAVEVGCIVSPISTLFTFSLLLSHGRAAVPITGLINTYEFSLSIALYSFITFPWFAILEFLLVFCSFIINVPSSYNDVTSLVTFTVHVVLFVTFFIVTWLSLNAPFWLFVQVTTPSAFSIFGVILNIPSSL